MREEASEAASDVEGARLPDLRRPCAPIVATVLCNVCTWHGYSTQTGYSTVVCQHTTHNFARQWHS